MNFLFTDTASDSCAWPKLKYVARIKGGAGFPPEEQGQVGNELPFYKVNALEFCTSDGVLSAPGDTVSGITAGKLGAHIFQPGTTVFAKVGAALLLNRFRQLNRLACLDNNMMGLEPDESRVLPRYLMYAMATKDLSIIANPGAVPSVSASQIADERIPCPSVAQQTRIANFLDEQTARIDALIAEKERLDGLLGEYRASLISAAVTGQLDMGTGGALPRAHGGGGGVNLNCISVVDALRQAWFENLPRDWNIKPVRIALQERYTKNDLGVRDNYLSLISGVGIVPYAEKGDLGNKKPEDLSKCKCVEKGDFVINSMNFVIGGFGRSGFTGICSAVYIVAKPNEQQFDPRFLMRVFQVSEFQRYVGRLGKGILELRMAIGWDELKNQAIPAPPLSEQTRIANFLDEQTARIDDLREHCKEHITLLREYRSSLISAAVTGQLNIDKFGREVA